MWKSMLIAACAAALTVSGTAQAATAAKPAPVAEAPLTAPEPVAVLAMVRSTLLAVDHGNRTGNYTVLRDLAGPQFREANNAARLAQIFGPVALQGVDLLAVAVAEPVYAQPPQITADRKLQITGVFRIAPRPVTFEILYEPVGGQWRLFSVAILPS